MNGLLNPLASQQAPSQETSPHSPASPEPGRREPGQGDNRGLECRRCGCKHFRVIYTRPTWGGRIQRRRECRHCGKRITTWERTGG